MGLAGTAVGGSPLAVDGDVAVVVDCRLDDRRGLAARLEGLGEARSVPLSNAELVLAAYRRWGLDCVDRLEGDFAFVVWDGAEGRLVAARDAPGVRQLVWTRDGDRLIVASNVAAVVAGLGREPEPNWDLLRDQLARRWDRWLDETCHRDLHRLPPAHRLTFARGCSRVTRWTRLGERIDRRNRTDEQHIAAFGEALAAAVATRIEGEPVGLLVSGGLDSSSLACLAERAVAGGLGARVRLYSQTFERSPGADESEFREAVFAHCHHLAAIRVPSDDLWALSEFGTDGGFPLDEPERDITRGALAAVARLAVADGCVALLGGHWGDQVLGSWAYGAASALADVPLGRLRRELPHFRRYGRRSRLALAAFAVAGPLISERLRRWIGTSGEPSARARALLPPPALGCHSARLSYYQLTSGWTAASLASLDRVGRWLGFEWRLPFLDRKVIECSLALPARLRFSEGQTKLVLRRAMSEVLPEKVLLRRGRAYFDALVERGLRHEERDRIMRLLDQPRVVECGLLSASTLDRLVFDYFEREIGSVPYRNIASLLCVEAWLRHHRQP